MQTLNMYAHSATEQQKKSMKGQGIPLDFIHDLETGVIDIDCALKNTQSHIANDLEYHTADVHCALAAIHFVIARNDNSSEELLDQIRNDFLREMQFFLKHVPFQYRTKLEEELRRIISTQAEEN